MIYYNIATSNDNKFWLDPTENTNSKEKTETSGKLRSFLKDISGKLKDNYEIEITNDGKPLTPIHSYSYVKEAVKDIQRKVCGGFFFWICSLIPNTSAYKTRLLFNQVIDQLNEKLGNFYTEYHYKNKSFPSPFTPRPSNNYSLNNYVIIMCSNQPIKSLDDIIKALQLYIKNFDDNREFTEKNFTSKKIDPTELKFTFNHHTLCISSNEYTFTSTNDTIIDNETKNKLFLLAFKDLIRCKTDHPPLFTDEYIKQYFKQLLEIQKLSKKN